MNYFEAMASSAGDVAALAEIVAGLESADVALRRAEVAHTRLLARAGQLAAAQAAGSRESVRAHDMALRAIAAELGGVLRIADRTAQRRIDEARDIVENYPATLRAWDTGDITRGHVRVIVDAGTAVPTERRSEYEREAITRCLRDRPNRVRPEIEILAERMTERSFTERHREAAAERRVRLVPGRAGMTGVVATVPTGSSTG